jgi:hypothetical protein
MFYDKNHFTSRETGTKEPKVLQHERTRDGGGPFPLQMGKEERGTVSGNTARENSCRVTKCHMVSAEVYTSVNFPSFPKKRKWN